jgi:hypothetical protein
VLQTLKIEVHLRQINKAIFQIIEKYHRLYGLEFHPFSHSSFGPIYWGVQIAAKRTWSINNKQVNDNELGQREENGYSLISYLHYVFIPSWAANKYLDAESGQPSLETISATRTVAIVEWLEQHMQLDNYLTRYQSEISRWRSSYSVEDAEKYILMMNLAGLITTQHGTQILTPGQVLSTCQSLLEL